MRVLHVIPDLRYGGATKQLTLLVRHLPRDRFESRVCVLQPDPRAHLLQEVGVGIDLLNWRRLLDPRPLWRLRHLLRSWRPDIIHAWRPASLRAILLAGGRKAAHRVASAALIPGAHGPQLNRLDRWLLQWVDRVLASSSREARCLQSGLAQENVTLVRPAVEVFPALSPSAIGLGPSAIFCAGPLEPYKGFRDAIWAFDILSHYREDVHLLLAGTGSDRECLEQFARVTGLQKRIHFLGELPDLAGPLIRAEVVWIPSRTQGGVNVALEAQALGRPVIASHLPELQEIVRDGQTGLLVPPGNKVALACQTRRLLEDAGLRQRLGEAGRQRARGCFAPDEMARTVSRVYEEIAAGGVAFAPGGNGYAARA
jgi:glycosyltransferase involved in cell wall biosynthesis